LTDRRSVFVPGAAAVYQLNAKTLTFTPLTDFTKY
jgi:hypothetical protein